MPSSAAAKAAEENRRRKATEDARKRAAATAKKPERTKDDDARKEPTYKPPARTSSPAPYVPPDAQKRPTWRSEGPPPGAGGQRREQGPPAPSQNKWTPPSWRSEGPPAAPQRVKDDLMVGPPRAQDVGPMVPQWKSQQPMGPPAERPGPLTPNWRSSGPPVVSFGDREPLDTPASGLQVSLSTPRPNTGPAGLSSSQQTAPTATTPSVNPWRPERNVEDQTQIQANAWGGQRETKPAEGPPVANPAFGFMGWAGPLQKGVELSSNAWESATNSFTNSAAWEKAQRDMEQRRAPEERTLIERARDWYKQGLALDEQYQGQRDQEIADYQAGKQGLGETAWDLTKGLGQYAASGAGMLMGLPGVVTPSTKPTEKLGQYAGDAMAAIQATTDYAMTRPVGDTTAGAWLESTAEGTWDFYKNIFLSATGQADFNPYGAGRQKYESTQKRFAEATTPTPQQAQQMTPQEVQKQQERAYLNWADPASVAKTFDALVDAPSQAAAAQQQAQQLLQQAQQTTDPQQRQELMTQAADAGRQAYRFKNAHPIDIVNENTNLWRQMAFEVLLPDITDLAGGVIAAAKLTPKARRMASVESAIFQNEQKAMEALNRIQAVEGTAKIATAVKDTGYNKWLNLWTTGTARADIDAAEMMKVTSTLLADADTASDARILLTQLARDPKELVTGIAANLFQSTGLLARADADGMIRFGTMGLNTKTVQTALNSFRSIADEFLANADTFKRDGALNKIDAAMEMAEAVRQGGYRAYGVATDLGNMPLGTSRVKVRTTSNGQAFLEYVGEDGKTVLKQSDAMTLIDANKQAAEFNKVKKTGALAQSSMLNQISAMQRSVVSPFYIYLSPGTWATNIVNAAATAMGDQSMIWGGIEKMNAHTAKLFGGIKPTLRSMEGVETAANVAGQTGGVMGPLKKAYSGVEEFFAERVAYRSMTDAMKKYGPRVMEQSLIPVLTNAGVDPKLAKSWAKQLFETGYRGEDMTAELGRLLTGNAKLFSISDANPAWLDALDADSQSKLYDILRTSPDAATAQAKLTELFDNARNPWEGIIQQAPPVPQRYAWQTAEGAKDAADFAQASKMAEKYAGVPPEASKAAREAQLAAQQAIDQKLQALTSMVTEASDPNARYLLYNTWGQMYDETTKVRLALAEAAEEAYETKDWAKYWQTAQQAWAGRNEKVNGLLEQTGAALVSGQPVTPNFGTWDILERTARRNEDALWATLRMEPQSGRYDERMAQVIEAGRALTDKQVARTYAAARRFGGPSVMDEIISAERSVQIAGAQARSHLDKALQQALKSGKWEDYFSIRNEVWRQLRQYEAGTWRMAERNIIEEGMGIETKTGLTFDYFGEQVELVRPIEKEFKKKVRTGPQVEIAPDPQQYWQVKRPDGKMETIPAAQVPEEVRAKYGKAPDVRGETELELDNVASGAALAPEAQQVANKLQPGQSIWRQGDIDRPVTITGITEKNGVEYYTIEGSNQLVSTSDLYEVTQDRKLRKVGDTDAMRRAQETVQMNAEEVAAAKQAREDMRAEWNRVAKGERGYLKLDSAVAAYVRQGIARVPENKFEDLYGLTVAGRKIESQSDVEALLQEYYNLNQSINKKQRLSNEARLAAQEAKLATVDPQKIATDLNLGGQATTDNWEEVSRKTSRATTAAGGTLPPDQSLAAQHALDMLEQLRTHMLGNLENIMQPGGGKIGEGQLFNVINQFKQQVIPQWDNVKYGASEFSDRMRSFTMVDFRNRTRMDEILGLATPYSFWFTRAAKNSAERMVFEPHIWRRVQQTEKYISEIREQQGDPKRYDGAIPIQIGDKTFYLRVSPSKYWSVFPNMIQNDYADPESANTAVGFALDSAQAVGFNYFPWLDAGKKYLEGNTEDIYPVGYLPQGRILAETAQAAGMQLPGWAKPQFSEYNSGREALLALVGGEKVDGQAITPEEVQFVMDALRQQKTGEAALPGQQMTPRLQKILALAEQRSAQKGLTSSLSSWLTGVAVKPYDPNERQIMEAKAAYNERGYGPENPYGSKEAKSATFDESPFLSPAYSLGAVYNQDQTRPGVSAENSLKSKEKEAIFAEMNTAVDKFLAQNPDASKQDLYNLKAAYYERVNALDEKYPNAAYPEGKDPTGGMNPEEKQQYLLEQAYRTANALPKPEWPGDDASKEEKAKYYADLKAYEEQKRQTALDEVSGLGDVERGRIELSNDQVLQGYEDFQNRNKTDTEIAFIERKDAEAEAKRAAYEQQAGGSGEYANEWDAYRGLGDDYGAKAKFMRDNPEFAAYYKDKYLEDDEVAWWEKEHTPRPRRPYSRGGGRSRGGGGQRRGGRGGGSGGYSSGYGSTRQQSPEIYARQMDKDLEVTERDIRPWRPRDIDWGWMSAGRELRPDKLQPWRKPS